MLPNSGLNMKSFELSPNKMCYQVVLLYHYRKIVSIVERLRKLYHCRRLHQSSNDPILEV